MSQFVPVKNSQTAPKAEPPPRQRAKRDQGSVFKKLVTGRLPQTFLGLTVGFQENHKLLKLNNVRLAFSPKTKVLSFQFVKKAVEGETFAVERDQYGYAKIPLTSFLRTFELQLKSLKVLVEPVKSRKVFLVDLSDNLKRYDVPEVKRDEEGKLAKLSREERAERMRALTV